MSSSHHFEPEFPGYLRVIRRFHPISSPLTGSGSSQGGKVSADSLVKADASVGMLMCNVITHRNPRSPGIRVQLNVSREITEYSKGLPTLENLAVSLQNVLRAFEEKPENLRSVVAMQQYVGPS